MDATGRGSRPPVRYRYRTAAVIGPWRETPEAALRDAVNAGQALADEDEPGGIRWKLPGTIEADRRGRRP